MYRLVLVAIVFFFACSGAAMAIEASQDLQGWSYESVQGDIPVGDLLDRSVQNAEGRVIGRIRDVLISDTGKIEAVAVEFDHESGDGFAIARMSWSDAALLPDDEAVSVQIGWQDSASSAQDDASMNSGDVTGTAARDMIGMPVRFARSNASGHVNDIFVDTESRQPSAVLVQMQGGVYAVPANAMLVNSEIGAVTFPYNEEDVQQMGEFNVDTVRAKSSRN